MRSAAIIALVVPLVAGLWPLPKTYTNGSAVLWLDPNVVMTYSAPLQAKMSFTSSNTQTDSTSSLVSARIVQKAAQRTLNTINKQNFIPWMLNERDSDYEPSVGSNSVYIKTITLTQTSLDPTTVLKPAAGAVNESYTLDITTAGAVTISAPSSIGLSYALSTFTQFFYEHSSGGPAYMKSAPVHIVDAPLFPHRGLNLDVARSYMPVSTIKRTIDGMAYNKLNRLHVHVTDSQSWPLVIASMPELAAKGAYAPNLVYTPANVRDLQNYGALLGVEVYFEIDMPGHIGSIHYAYPDLIAAANVQPAWGNYSSEPPSGQFRLNSTDVYSFLTNMWNDLLPRLSQYSSMFHTGGDEFKYSVYGIDPTVNSVDPAVITPLLQKFIDFNHARIRQAGMTPVVWEEMLLNYNITLGSDVIISTWLSDQSVLASVQKGYKALAGAYELWYLDCGMGQWLVAEPGATAASAYPYTDWCGPRHSWELAYSYDPLSSIPANLSSLVLGGEASIWTEQTDAISLDFMLWPRLSAVAEVLWAGAKDASGQSRSQVTAAPRLADMRERLVARGIQATPVFMPFCSQGTDQCVLGPNTYG